MLRMMRQTDFEEPLPKKCMNCSRELKRSKMFMSKQQLRYLFFLYCPHCGLNWPVKITITKKGHVKERVPVDEGELKMLRTAIIDLDGNVSYDRP